jgi:hypothetical protein
MKRANEPVLSADFAERVLARADGVMVRRRRIRRVLGVVVAVTVVSAAAASWVVTSGFRQPAISRQASRSVVIPNAATEAQADETDALSDLFPDAESVASFATEYSSAAENSETAIISDDDAASS